MTLKTTLTATAVAALVAGSAFADAHKTGDKADMTQMPKVTADAAAAGPEWIKNMTVGDIIGMSVRTPAGDDVGEIDYVIVQDGTVAGVIGVGGFLGLGEYTVAMPLTDFEMGDGEGELIRDLVISKTAEELKAMPEISEMGLTSIDGEVLLSEAIANPVPFARAENGVPATIGTNTVGDTAEADVAAAVTEDEIATSVTNVDMTPLTERTVDDVIGLTVVDQRNRVVGEIDYIVDSYDTVAAVIGIGGFLGLGEYTVSLPFEEFELTADNRLEISMTEDELKALPEIDESEIESIDGDMRIADVI